MENVIIVVVLVLLAALAVRPAWKHFRGKGGCCGGEDYRPKRKKLSRVLYTRSFSVEGMHCAHCKNRVEEAVNDIKGVAGRVNLKKGTLTVSYAQEVDECVLAARLARLGYTLK